MITIQGKEFRNFAEQINKNKGDIAKLSTSPSSPTGGMLKPYLLLVNFNYINYNAIPATSYGYAIVYMTAAEADERESEQSIPNYIQLSAVIATSSGTTVITDIQEYQPSTHTLITLTELGGLSTLTVNSVHYQEFS